MSQSESDNEYRARMQRTRQELQDMATILRNMKVPVDLDFLREEYIIGSKHYGSYWSAWSAAREALTQAGVLHD